MSETYDASLSLNVATVADLLRTPSPEQQLAWLRGQGWLTQSALQQLLQLASESIGSDPVTAGTLAQVCMAAAQTQAWPDLAGQATYLRAQVYAMQAEFEPALQHIALARQYFLEANNPQAALRTDVGRMNVMRELGQCREAIVLGLVSLQHITAQMGEQSLVAARMKNNLSICYEQLGQFDEAIRYFTAAEAAFYSNNASEEASHAQNNRGLVYLKQGQAHNALAAFEAAARVFAENDLALNLAQARINMSHAHFMLGDPGLGLACLDDARNVLDPLGASADNLVLLLDTAEAYQTLNLQPEARQLYERVVPALHTAGMTDERMRAVLGLSSAFIAQGQFGEAVTLLNELDNDLQDALATPIRCRLMLNRASALARTGREAEAAQQATLALSQATAQGWQRQLAEVHLLCAELSFTPPADAIAHLQQAQHMAQQVGWPAFHTLVQQRLGHAYLRNGFTADAETLLVAAIADVEHARATLTEDRFRIAFLQNKADAFDDLVQLYLRRSQQASEPAQQQAALQTAFAFAERAKSRALLDLMTDGMLPDAKRVATPTFSWAEVRAQLDDKTVLLYFYACGEDISAFVMSKHNTTIDCVPMFSQVSTIASLLDALAVQWERFLAGPEFVTRYAPQLEAATQRVLFQLYQALMVPVESLIQTHQALAPSGGGENYTVSLVITAHGLLHQVPFHALHDGADYLIERYEISYAPSATTFLLSQQRQSAGLSKALIVGVEDASIPMAQVEAELVAHQLTQSSPPVQALLRTGTQATVQQLQADVADCDLVHLACHGLFRPGNPLFSSLQLHGSTLTAADVAQLKLNGALVTLGACESGRSEVVAGDELLGLPRAFLGAGASSVLVSLWLVHDATSAEFMQGWYGPILRGQPRAQALRAVQRQIKRQHPHPYYWAPFVLVGQR